MEIKVETQIFNFYFFDFQGFMSMQYVCFPSFIPNNHQNAPLNLYLFPLNFFKKFFRKLAMQEFL